MLSVGRLQPSITGIRHTVLLQRLEEDCHSQDRLETLELTHGGGGAKGRGRPSSGGWGQEDGIAMKGSQSNVKWGGGGAIGGGAWCEWGGGGGA